MKALERKHKAKLEEAWRNAQRVGGRRLRSRTQRQFVQAIKMDGLVKKMRRQGITIDAEVLKKFEGGGSGPRSQESK